jgi:hypothetical protein
VTAKFFAPSFFLLLLSVLGAAATGQTLTTGDLVGTVLDPSGAVVRDAKVSLRSNEHGFSQEAMSNDRGSYRFAFLLPSSYTVTVSHPGFATSAHEIMVRVGRTT